MNENRTTWNAMATAVHKFNWIEYSVFGSLLGISLVIGVYYGFIKKNQNTTIEYLLGGKSMSVLPIAISLISSHVSGISILGVPAEIYDYGMQYATMCFTYIFAAYFVNIFLLPVFYPLQHTSLFEYLELRFSKRVRKATSLIFALSVIIINPAIIYIPSLAFQQATGISVHHFSPIICLLCIFYTTVGGLKTVVWTDTIQGGFTWSALVIVIIIGLIDAGGVGELHEQASAGERMEFFDTRFNPLIRNTIWSTVIGGLFYLPYNFAFHPGSLQRYIALPTMEGAKRSVWVCALGMVLAKVLCILLGLLIYVKYRMCDPVTAGTVKNTGQLIPFYVQDIATNFPGLTGIFIASLVSAALSTISANLNTLAGTMYEDFFSPCLTEKSKEAKANFTMKLTVIIAGCLCVLMVYVVEHLGAILQMVITVQGITQGAASAIFIMGVLLPWVNEKGAIWGMICSVLCVGWLVINNQLAISNKHLTFDKKPMNTAGCSTTDFIQPLNSSLTDLIQIAPGVHLKQDLSSWYALSFFLYNVVGTIVALVVGLLVTLVSRNDLNDVDPVLITPMVRRFMPQQTQIVQMKLDGGHQKYREVPQTVDRFDDIQQTQT